jgi:hypothetical protein
MSEEILDIIRCQRHGVFYGALLPEGRYYGLYFTSNRIIVAVLSGSIYTVIGKVIADYSSSKRSDELKKLSPESILKAKKTNFEIPYAEITKVEIKKPRALSAAKIRIFTHTKKYKFVFATPGKSEFEAHENLVRSALPDKLFIS